jgi:hypothetical protein
MVHMCRKFIAAIVRKINNSQRRLTTQNLPTSVLCHIDFSKYTNTAQE